MLVVVEEEEFERFPPYVTWMIVGLNVAVFIVEMANPAILEEFAMVPALILRGQGLTTILTSMFTHAGLIHIFSNMYALWVFGDDCENVYGHGTFLLFYLACGVGAALLHCFMSPTSKMPVVGASGAIFGVMAAYAIFFPWRRLYVFIYPALLPLPAIVFVAFYAAFEFLYVLSGLNPFVAHTAHIGGFLTGVLLSVVYRASKRPRIYKTRQRWW